MRGATQERPGGIHIGFLSGIPVDSRFRGNDKLPNRGGGEVKEQVLRFVVMKALSAPARSTIRQAVGEAHPAGLFPGLP